MPVIEVAVPEEVYAEFERLAAEEFVNQDEAVDELLSAGLDAYTRAYDDGEQDLDFAEEYADDMWDTAGGPDGNDGGEFGR